MKQITLTMEELFEFAGYFTSETDEIQIKTESSVESDLKYEIYLENQNNELTPIKKLIKKSPEDWVNIKTEDDIELTVSLHHKIPVIENNEMKIIFAKDLNVKKHLLISKNEYKKVKIKKIIKNTDELLYGFSIDHPHLYFDANGILHHNTAYMCFLTGSSLLQKENILYITLEMPEEAIAKRIDASLLGFTIQELEDPSNINNIRTKWNSIKDKLGNLVIKEYGAGTFSSLDLENLLDELRLEKNFIPDVVMIDHLILMYSPKAGKGSNSYEMVGKVSEELHGIAKKYNDSKGNKGIKVISGMQANRSAYNQTDMGLENMSESIKVAMTADVVVGIISNEELRANNQQIWKLLKNRFSGLLDSTLVQTDFSRMTYTEIAEEPEDFNPNGKIDKLANMNENKFDLDTLDTSGVHIGTTEESPLNFDNLNF